MRSTPTPFELPALDQLEALVARHRTSAPRYTSYPPAPVWSDDYGPRDLADALALAPDDPSDCVSVYVHVPFCRSLCHFCACNRVVTQDQERPVRYLETLAAEARLLRESRGPVRCSQLHWGGGTPTHLSPRQIEELFRITTDAFPLRTDAEVSIEVDPRVTTDEHVKVLADLGFRRMSLGVQDTDPRVQQAIHRIQPIATTGTLVERARADGFDGIGFDLIYGLPYQTVETFERTLDTILSLVPDRIALYPYAHVPWVAKQQRGFERGDLPAPDVRLRIFLTAITRLLDVGYVYVGMDHFARPDDALALSLADGSLNRNFMGYTTRAGLELLALGPSGISELASDYAQSHRGLDEWDATVRAGELPVLRGHVLSDDDRARRWVIRSLLCQGVVRDEAFRAAFGVGLARRFAPELTDLAVLQGEGLVRFEDEDIVLTSLGRLFARNVALRFDAYASPIGAAAETRFSATV
jgi:oxygen-independent coproporphyrinogen-3 oxidase